MTQEHLIIIKTVDDFKKLSEYLADKEYVSFDCETDGLDKESRIIGFSIAADVDTGYYVILSYWDTATESMIDLETKDLAKDFITSLVNKKLIMHNGVFDCSMVNNNFNVDLMPSLHTDTLILAHLLNENRRNGLKELGVSIFGQNSNAEQLEVKESAKANGASLTKDKFELYKADADIMAKYGAKDAILTIKLFFHLLDDLFNQGLDQFFYDDESMPLLRGPTYDLNTTGLRVDLDALQKLKLKLETDIAKEKAFIYQEILPSVRHQYPGDKKANTFNIDSSSQRAWLMHHILQEEFHVLTDAGREVCKLLGLRLPYTKKAKEEFIKDCIINKDREYGKTDSGRPQKVRDPWVYIKSDQETLKRFEKKYRWVAAYLRYAKMKKLLDTYVIGIQERQRYGVIRPGFLQHGTTSGRYSSTNPNFQNLPRNDKRVKKCIIARPGKVFVGADYSQLEPRVFASLSGDERLLKAFEGGDDFYSTIGMEVFDKYDCIPKKDGSDEAFGVKYPELRDIAKVVALSSTYGTTPNKMAPTIGKSISEAKEVIESYFDKFPKVKQLMLDSHKQVRTTGVVHSLFGRPRRIPDALDIDLTFGPGRTHEELEYNYRNMLNLAINHRIQSTGASIMNRAAINVWKTCKRYKVNARIVLQVHDELVVECDENDADIVAGIIKSQMEGAVNLPGVNLEAIPKIAKNLGDLK